MRGGLVPAAIHRSRPGSHTPPPHLVIPFVVAWRSSSGSWCGSLAGHAAQGRPCIRKGTRVSRVIVGMTVSLDGFINDRTGSVEALYSDLGDLRNTALMKESVRRTGAVVMGWKAFAMAGDPDWYAGNYEYQVPIFVVTRQVPARPPKQTGGLSFTFVTDVESAVRQATGAAAERDTVIVGGAATAQRCMAAGLVDFLHIDIASVLLGDGTRLFEDTNEQKPLRRHRVEQLPSGRTHMEFQIVR